MDYDDNYDEFDYDDAADDWEAEAAEEEVRTKEEAKARALREEKKLAIRAPLKKEQEELETVLPEDVQRAVEALQQLANDIASGSGLISGESVELIADLPVDTADHAEALGKRIAERLLEFSEHSNFEQMLQELWPEITQELKTIQVINDACSKATIAVAETKRNTKVQKKKKGTALRQGTDVLGLNDVEDKGGAVEVADEGSW